MQRVSILILTSDRGVNGSTQDSGSCGPGSNPGGPTHPIRLVRLGQAFRVEHGPMV
jgi:hypothetical protein